MKPTILFLFNSSSYAVQPWLDDGRFNVVSVDYDDTDHSAAHTTPQAGHTVLNIDLSQRFPRWKIEDALEELRFQLPSLVISFTPCTDLAVSGAAHFKNKLAKNPECQREAVAMARLAEQFNCAYMVENPVSVLATMWRKPDIYFHPYEFSGYLGLNEGPHPEFSSVIPAYDAYNKKTCLWTGKGFVLPVKRVWMKPSSDVNPGHQKLGGKSARTKYIRSLTPRGFARAVYEANAAKLLGVDNG